ncbi:MAG: C39 family peptidase [bacterium]|nr:C39 family peptidase [bacterium]
MRHKRFAPSILFSLFFLFKSLSIISNGFTQTTPYPDQQFIIETGDSLIQGAELISNITSSDDGKSIQLTEGATTGYLILNPQSSSHPFDIGLPSWNGTAPGDSGGFRILIRVPHSSDWSPWLDVGYWKANLWGSRNLNFSGGRINIDIVELYDYATQWQFAIEINRNSASVTSPTLSLVSFFVSDSRTTQNINYTSILNDCPEPIFITTTFLAQYRISSEIGGRICSPTTVAMILLSYGIEVDPLQFALDTYDPYWKIFGVWPRVVQNASEYGVKGTVTRYRTWSEAREVLAKGGRIGMSIGSPLYTGHLVMLAGFTENGDPIVHDPARTYDGYAHVFNKYDLSRSWFAKGGVAYTIFPNDTSAVSPVIIAERQQSPTNLSFELYPNYPNPFNSTTTFQYKLNRDGFVEFYIFNLLGELVNTLVSKNQFAGMHQFQWDGRDFSGTSLASGGYFYQIRFDHNEVGLGKLLIVK